MGGAYFKKWLFLMADLIKSQTAGHVQELVAKYEAKYLGGAIPRPPFWSGLRVVPAPTAYRERPRFRIGDLIPSAKGLTDSSRAWHEWIGRAWYSL